MRDLRPQSGNVLLPALLCAMTGFFAALYAIDPSLYLRLIGLWSFKVTAHPFLDSEYVFAQIACWNKGIDVYSVNPCDPLGRLHDYSPLWLRLSFIGDSHPIVQWSSLAQDALFALSLGFLPAPRHAAAWALIVAAAVSPTMVFALERGNVDLIMVAIVIAGLACLERSFIIRLCAYGLFLIAGLLKFYPLVMLARALDERTWRFGAIAAVSAAAVAWFGWQYAAEIPRALANVPRPSDFGDAFGSRQLGDGLAYLLHVPRAGFALWLFFCVTAIVVAQRLSSRLGLAQEHLGLGARAWSCLCAGALLFCGCFLAGPSVGYRGVMLMLVLPGLIELGRLQPTATKVKILRRAPAVIVAAMWNFVPMRLFGPHGEWANLAGPLPFFAVWAVRELLWWVIFMVLLAVIMRFVRDSRIAAVALTKGKRWVVRAAPPVDNGASS